MLRSIDRGGYMSMYKPGDYIKVEFKENSIGESEWMWVRIDRADDIERVVYGNWITSR
jgi:hypothetical protein